MTFVRAGTDLVVQDPSMLRKLASGRGQRMIDAIEKPIAALDIAVWTSLSGARKTLMGLRQIPSMLFTKGLAPLSL